MNPSLVVQGAKYMVCGGCGFRVCAIYCWLSLESTALTTVWSLVSAVGVFNVCKCYIPLGSIASDQGRQWQYSELVVCTHLAAEVTYRCLCSGRAGCRHTPGGGDQHQQQWLWPTAETVAAAGVLDVDMYSYVCTVMP